MLEGFSFPILLPSERLCQRGQWRENVQKTWPVEKASETDSLFTEEMQDLWESKEKGGEPKALQPGKPALGGEAIPLQLHNEEKQNNPVADPVELTQRCWGTLLTHPHERRQLPMHAANSPKDRGASTHQSEHQRCPSWHQQQHYVYHTYSTLCLLLPRSSNLHNQ